MEDWWKGKYEVTEALLSLQTVAEFFFLFKVNKYKTLGLLIRWELHYFVSGTKAHFIFSCKNLWVYFTELIGRFDFKKNKHLEMYFFKGNDKKSAKSAPALSKICLRTD